MPRRISEAKTRKEMIDPQLEKAGWYLRDHSKVRSGIPACPDDFCGDGWL
jgi:type I site-specific restriction endonuclease